MDRHSLALFIPILALAIPIVAMVFAGLRKLAQLRVEEARVRAGSDGLDSAVPALQAQLDDLRRDLGEVHERLDFAERVLSQQRTIERLPDGGAS